MFEKSDKISDRRLKLNDKFPFDCHPGLACFNSCCREKRLYLYPYDILRLRRALNITSDELLENYIEYDIDPETGWPLFLLKLAENGQCKFVSPEGCKIYPDRPSCCRMYPLARAMAPGFNNEVKEIFYVIDPNYCHGWDEDVGDDLSKWIKTQELAEYQATNNRLTKFFMHPGRPSNMKLSEHQLRAIITALYNIDTFREMIREPAFGKHFNYSEDRIKEAIESDEILLELGQDWLTGQFFG